MTESKLRLEGLYQLNTESTRRKFLAVLAGTGVNLAGLQAATESAFGEKPDGKPLVWRYDRFGNPETVRYIPEERYRRIQVYENIHPSRFYERTDEVNGVTLAQRSNDSKDLVLKTYVDHNTHTVRRNLPNQVKQIPVTVEERKTDREWAVCNRRALDFYDPLPANPEISTYDSNEISMTKGHLEWYVGTTMLTTHTSAILRRPMLPKMAVHMLTISAIAE